jgi:hypothetical protein
MSMQSSKGSLLALADAENAAQHHTRSRRSLGKSCSLLSDDHHDRRFGHMSGAKTHLAFRFGDSGDGYNAVHPLSTYGSADPWPIKARVTIWDFEWKKWAFSLYVLLEAFARLVVALVAHD